MFYGFCVDARPSPSSFKPLRKQRMVMGRYHSMLLAQQWPPRIVPFVGGNDKGTLGVDADDTVSGHDGIEAIWGRRDWLSSSPGQHATLPVLPKVRKERNIVLPPPPLVTHSSSPPLPIFFSLSPRHPCVRLITQSPYGHNTN